VASFYYAARFAEAQRELCAIMEWVDLGPHQRGRSRPRSRIGRAIPVPRVRELWSLTELGEPYSSRRPEKPPAGRAALAEPGSAPLGPDSFCESTLEKPPFDFRGTSLGRISPRWY
jgi:hypothetical protein